MRLQSKYFGKWAAEPPSSREGRMSAISNPIVLPAMIIIACGIFHHCAGQKASSHAGSQYLRESVAHFVGLGSLFSPDPQVPLSLHLGLKMCRCSAASDCFDAASTVGGSDPYMQIQTALNGLPGLPVDAWMKKRRSEDRP
jgi:hypothetical protein